MHTCRICIYKHLNMQLPIYVYVPLKLHARQPMLWVSSSSPSPSRSPKTVTLATLCMLLCPPWSCVAWGVAWNSRNEARRSQAFSRYSARARTSSLVCSPMMTLKRWACVPLSHASPQQVVVLLGQGSKASKNAAAHAWYPAVRRIGGRP